MVIAQNLAALGADVWVADPYAAPGTTALRQVLLTADEVRQADAVVVVTDHDDFDMEMVGNRHGTCSIPAIGSADHESNRCDGFRPPVKVVVTGGAGFIGANLCRVLAGQDFVEQVVALEISRPDHERIWLDSPAVEFVEGSILNAADLDQVVAGTHAIVHLAARPSVPRSLADPMATHRVNATGTMKVLEAARRHGAGHVIVASSSSVYGANPALPKREDMVPMPVSPYAASKLAAEAYTFSYARSFDLPVLVFRFFNVFGPLQSASHVYAAVVPAFVSCRYGDSTAGPRRRLADPRLHLRRHRRLGLTDSAIDAGWSIPSR